MGEISACSKVGILRYGELPWSTVLTDVARLPCNFSWHHVFLRTHWQDFVNRYFFEGTDVLRPVKSLPPQLRVEALLGPVQLLNILGAWSSRKTRNY